MVDTTSRTDRAAGPDRSASFADQNKSVASPTVTPSRPATIGRDRRETDATRFLIASVAITATIFILINVIVHFSERAHTAGAVAHSGESKGIPSVYLPY